ncbi:MAG: lipocalin-like domain-containing protein [Candidatus Lokiarchaeota archaeon]
MNERGNCEWWYFDARLDNGYTIVVFYRAKHERTGKTGVELVIYKPNHEKIQKIYNYKRSDFTASLQKAEITIGKNYIHSEYSTSNLPKYEIYLKEDEFEVHLNFQATIQSWIPGSGYTQFEDLGVFGWVIPIPRADVTGEIKIGGQNLDVQGIGYHDHNWIDFNLVKLVDYWMWGRMYSDNFTLIYAYIKCNHKWDDYPIKVLMLAKNSEILQSTGEFDLIQQDFKFHENLNNRYPKKLIIKLSEGNIIDLEVEKIIDSDNLLFELNPLVRVIAKNLLRLNPCYFRFYSNFEMKLSIQGNYYQEKGTTLHEMVMIK